MLKLLQRIKITRYTILYIAIIGVSSLQLMAGRAEMIGEDVHTIIPSYAHWEVYGGLGLAVLEAIVISSFLAPAWMKLKKGTVYWWIIGALMLLILFSIPLFSTPAMMAVQFGQRVRNVLNAAHVAQYPGVWVWTLFGTSIVSLMALALGLSRDVMEAPLRDIAAEVANEKLRDNSALPDDIAARLGVPVADVRAVYSDMREAFGVNGKRTLKLLDKSS